MEKITTFRSQFVAMPVDNIDTDQIIPARFLKTISKAGLGDQLFNDWRYEADGSPKADFVLNQDWAKRRQVLLAGDNFGCGSSREHAPWALTQYGFRKWSSAYVVRRHFQREFVEERVAAGGRAEGRPQLAVRGIRNLQSKSTWRRRS